MLTQLLHTLLCCEVLLSLHEATDKNGSGNSETEIAVGGFHLSYSVLKI